MKRFVLDLDLHDDKEKRKALKTVSSLQGIDFIGMDMKGKKLSVIGTVDPISAVCKLRKFWPRTEIIAVGPAVVIKEPSVAEKKKKEGCGGGSGDPRRNQVNKRKEDKSPVVATMPPPEYQRRIPYYNPNPDPPPTNNIYYYYHNTNSMEENPNACSIS